MDIQNGFEYQFDYQQELCMPMMEMDEVAGRGGSTAAERKRRFTEEQIRSLESMFHAHHAKLDPREKAELARELGLRPRQVAIWFQNKRARWRSKQLEHDFAALRADYDALHSSVETLHQEKLTLTAQLHELSERLRERSSGGATATTTTSSSSCNGGVQEQLLYVDDTVVGGTTTTCADTPADHLSFQSGCDVDYDVPESFCGMTELWEPWPLVEWNAVA